MNELIHNIISTGVAFSPIIVMIVEAIKHTQIVPSRFTPLVSLSIGILLGVAIGFFFPHIGSISAMSISGLVAGGIACGLYDIANKK